MIGPDFLSDIFHHGGSDFCRLPFLGLNLQWGNSGLFNGGVVAFFGAGAYGTLILGGTAQSAHLGGFELFYPLALIGGMMCAGLMAWVVGKLTIPAAP